MFRLLAGWLTLFVVGTDLFVVSPLLPSLAGDFHISPESAGLTVTLFSLGYVIAAPLFGRLADHAGRGLVLTSCLVAFALANLLTSEAGNLPAMLVARGLCVGLCPGRRHRAARTPGHLGRDRADRIVVVAVAWRSARRHDRPSGWLAGRISGAGRRRPRAGLAQPFRLAPDRAGGGAPWRGWAGAAQRRSAGA
jgi:MFS family permease